MLTLWSLGRLSAHECCLLRSDTDFIDLTIPWNSSGHGHKRVWLVLQAVAMNLSDEEDIDYGIRRIPQDPDDDMDLTSDSDGEAEQVCWQFVELCLVLPYATKI